MKASVGNVIAIVIEEQENARRNATRLYEKADDYRARAQLSDKEADALHDKAIELESVRRALVELGRDDDDVQEVPEAE